MVCGWKAKSSVDLGRQAKKIIVMVGLLAVFPVVMPFLGVGILEGCSTYTIADYEAAKSIKDKDVSRADIGQCKELPDSASGENVYVENFRAFYFTYAVVIVALIFILPGYQIMVY